MDQLRDVHEAGAHVQIGVRQATGFQSLVNQLAIFRLARTR